MFEQMYKVTASFFFYYSFIYFWHLQVETPTPLNKASPMYSNQFDIEQVYLAKNAIHRAENSQ